MIEAGEKNMSEKLREALRQGHFEHGYGGISDESGEPFEQWFLTDPSMLNEVESPNQRYVVNLSKNNAIALAALLVQPEAQVAAASERKITLEDCYVGWCTFKNGAFTSCDSDASGAFKVYRWPIAMQAIPPTSRLLTEHQKAVEEAAGMGIDWGMADASQVVPAPPTIPLAAVEALREAGNAIKEAGSDLAYSEYSSPEIEYPIGHIARVWVEAEKKWDAALDTLIQSAKGKA